MPDHERQVERETILEADPERVWEALTDDALLSDWFAEDASIDPVPGGEVEVDCDDGRRRGTVRTVERERELAFTWVRPGEGESLVTFRLEPLETGTRLVVVERALDAPMALATRQWRELEWAGRLLMLESVAGALAFA